MISRTRLAGLTRLVAYRYVTAGLVLLAVLAVYGVAAFSRPAGTGRASGRTVPVSTMIVACPAPADGRVSVLTARTARRDGQILITQTKDRAPVGTLNVPGAAWFKDVEAADGSYTVRANGSLAAGLVAEQTTVQAKGADRGLAATRCTEPGTDHWFLGPGPIDAKDIDVHLVNVDDQPATVDLSALSGDGPLDTVDGRGTTVDPHSTKVIAIGGGPEGLGGIVANAQLLALRVQATGGRVAAAVRVRVADRKGVDWVPVTPVPATRVVVPGIFGGSGQRRLLIAVPGEADARIRVQAISSSGAFAPEGQDSLLAPAGTVTPLYLDRALSGKAAAVRLTSNRPIVAGFMAERSGDVAYGAATPPIGAGATGAVADNRLDSTLVLTAPEAAATVRVTTVTAAGALGTPQQVTVGAGRTAELKITAPSGGAAGYGLLISPLRGSGPVHAARVLSTKEQITVLPVGPALGSVELPPVGDSLTSVIP